MPPKRPDPKSSSSGSGAGAASKEENIYIPSFISKRPFYAGEDDGTQNDYLQHQRLQKQEDDTKWYDRGRKAGPAATKFRKGACENCGATTHGIKDCLERPRAQGAKWSGADIKADELIQDVKLGWDAKRDRWNGYDVKEYRSVIDDFSQLEELRREAQKSARRAGNEDGEDDGEDDGDGDQELAGDRYAEENDMSKHQSTATRQLRIREDTAKYLLNLDLDSAKYDPKTRTLVDAGATADKAADLFAEEGFLRGAGDAEAFERAQAYAWEAQEQSGDTTQHLQANPTAGEFLRKQERDAAERKRAEREQLLLDQYGASDQKSLPAAIRDMAVTESETFVEYDEYGLIKGAPKTVMRSKYAEDVLSNNHTTVWGSWWHNFTWGYACCRSQLKGSYCTGEAGKQAWEASERRRTGVDLVEEREERDDADGEAGADREAGAGREAKTASGNVDGDAKGDADAQGKAKKRTRDEMSGGVTEADLEEYRKKRTVADDPMAKMLGRDELVS